VELEVDLLTSEPFRIYQFFSPDSPELSFSRGFLREPRRLRALHESPTMRMDRNELKEVIAQRDAGEPSMKRNRFVHFGLGCIVVALGLGSRRYQALLPPFLARYSGDTLWATMVFVAIGFMAARWSTRRVTTAALALSYAVELSQLYHEPWIETLRQTTVGALVLGYGFLWSDLVCYTVGVALGAVIEVRAYASTSSGRDQ
jgi:hypothetical protein